jgi:hypothetical protein
MSNGKGSKPRNCFSKDFKYNYDNIDWQKKCKKCELKYQKKYSICPFCGHDEK